MPSTTSTGLKSKKDLQVIDDEVLLEGMVLDKSIQVTEESNIVDLSLHSDTLILSFKSIGRIENLVGFENLVKLCLDNNKIEEIVNLEHLTKLRWLDLSFNKIRKIQGLSTLTNLEDLTLYSNKISIIEELELCPKLQCLSLGNNKIDSLEQIIRLRQLSNLKMLTLAGNPVCEEAEYRMTVLAFVSHIKYLDYSMIDMSEVHIAEEQYHDELLDVQEKESVIAEKNAREKATSEYIAQLEEAGILFSYTLFDDMFNDDAEIEKLKHLPGVKDNIEQFKSSFKVHSEGYITEAMEKFNKKKKDVGNFERAISKV
jgi:hypothetical protein